VAWYSPAESTDVTDPACGSADVVAVAVASSSPMLLLLRLLWWRWLITAFISEIRGVSSQSAG